jgi:imidazolonepropionase
MFRGAEPDVADLAIDNIGQLISGDPEVGDRRGAGLLIRDGVVAAVTAAGARELGEVAQRIDAAGRCVLPGFVDSHTHLVFAGDRAEEFALRMAGQPYAAGGIQTTVDATRAASGPQLRSLAAARRAEALAAGITHLEIKSGYALDVAGEARLCQVAAEFTDDVTFLGAHLVPAEYRENPDAYVDLVCGEMLAACAPFARWVDVFCEAGAFDAEQSRAVLSAGAAAGLGLRVHGNQLGPGPGVGLAVELGAASVDHCTFLTDRDISALADSDTVATLLPATEFATRQPYPDARALLDAGVDVAIATNCNPGSSYTTSMALCIALAVREMSMTVEEAVGAATVGGAQALNRSDIGRLAPGCRGDAVILDAPSAAHLAYRPGVPLIAATVLGGELHPWTSGLGLFPSAPGTGSVKSGNE